MTWTPAETYTVKLEGVERAGYRAIAICGTRDPVLIGQIDDFLVTRARARCAPRRPPSACRPTEYQLVIRIYGRDGVMAGWEPVREIRVARARLRGRGGRRRRRTSPTRCWRWRAPRMLHTDFPGRLCKEGNMAFPFSPSDIELGPVFRFSIFHVVAPDDPYEMFPIEYETV